MGGREEYRGLSWKFIYGLGAYMEDGVREFSSKVFF